MATNGPHDHDLDSNPEILDGIVEHFTRLLRAGKHPLISDYQDQHPELCDEIEDVLASVAMIEQLKSKSNHATSPNQKSLDEASKLKQIGDYRIIREIGRGGSGVVFKAIHEVLGRPVAIKVMPTPLVNSEKHVERFKRESQSAAKLHHTNIVSVFGVGETEGFHYYVMDWVDGQTLSEVVFGLAHSHQASPTLPPSGATRIDTGIAGAGSHASTGRAITGGMAGDDTRLDPVSAGLASPSAMPSPSDASSNGQANGQIKRSTSTTRSLDSRHFRWAARLGANIADALAYAHDADILHRDIKPSNILLDRKGVVWITDFGLAKDGACEINLTKTGDVIGTPQYLAPESLEGKYDHRSEIYCLGLTLYELTTLQPAYAAGTTAEVIRAIATSSPMSVRRLNPSIPIDLSTIIDKAVSREPDSRYQTAQEIRSDLMAFVEDRPISARPPSTAEQVIKWSKRNPLAAMLAGVSGLLLVLVAISASTGYLYTIDALNKEADKSARLQIQQAEADKQRRAAVKSQEESEEFAEQLKAQYDRAESNIAITLEAFDEMFKQVVSRGASTGGELNIDGFDELIGIETSVTREDAIFLEKFLAFYDQFATQNEDNDSLKTESARAFRRVANIYQLVGEVDRSLDAYRKTIDLYEQILIEIPDSKETLIALVQTKNELSHVCRKNQDSREAITQNEGAIALLKNVPADRLDDELKLEMAKSLNSLGSSSALITAMVNSGSDNPPRPPAGPPRRRDDERSVPGWVDRFLGSPPPNPIPRKPESSRSPPPRNRNRPPGRERAPQRNQRGGRFAERGMRTDQAVVRRANNYSNQAIDILDPLIARSPENVDFRSVRANCYCSLATILLVPDPAKAIEMRNRAIEELESLILQDPDNPSFRYRLALVCSLVDPSEATDHEWEMLEKSAQITSELQSQFPKVLDYQYLFGLVRNKQAGQLIKRGDLTAALESLKMAKHSFEQVNEQAPSDRINNRMLQVLGTQFRALIVASEAAGKPEITREAKANLAAFRPRRGPPSRNPFGRGPDTNGRARKGPNGRGPRDGRGRQPMRNDPTRGDQSPTHP